MSNLKTKVVEGLPLNYDSTDPKDFIEVLNKIADAMGGVSNMGVFADITSVTQTNEMVARVADKYITVSTKRYEKPHRDLVVTTNVSEPYQFELDTLAGKNGSNIPSVLESFLSKVDKPVIADNKAAESSASSTKPENRFWGDKDDELPEEEEEEEDEEEAEEEEDEEDEDNDNEEDVSIFDAFKETGKEFASAFKETGRGFKDAFKLK